MQSYLQYRRIGSTVRKQVDQFLGESEAYVGIPVTGHSNPSDLDGNVNREREAEDSRENINHGHLQSANTTSSQRIALANSLAGVEVQNRADDASSQPNLLFVVGWEDENDPLNPRNYSLTRRLIATLIVSALAFIVGAASSINSGVLPQITEAFHVSDVVGSLVTGIYLIGFATGSLISGPLSEILGRNVVYTGSLTIFMIFVMASALAPNIGALLTFRFLAGVFGSPPLTCAGGTVADLWNPLEKTFMFPLYAILASPVIGPVIASYIGQTGVLVWQWTNWIILITSGLILVLVVFFQPETYSPLLLKWKARTLRKVTGDERYRSEMDMEKVALFSRIVSAMERQFLLTIHEPIILLISLYMTVIYIVLFTFLEGYMFIFSEVHGASQGLTNIIFVAMYVGTMLAGVVVPLIYRWTKREFEEIESLQFGTKAERPADAGVDSHVHDRVHTRPENRLWFAMIGAPAIPIGLFWMGWTSYSSISIWSPIIASAVFGFGNILVFISSYMYVIDSYSIYAASALGFMTISRYLAAGGMTVVGFPFYGNMGVHWTLTILASISVLMTPVPYVFYRYGVVIRGSSKYAVKSGEPDTTTE